MPFNTLVWRVLAKTPDDHYYEAVSGWFDRTSPEWLRLPLNPDAGANLADPRCTTGCAGSPATGCAMT